MIEALSFLAGLKGALLFIIGAFYVYSTFSKQDVMSRAETRSLSLSLELMLVFSGVNSEVTFYTGGLTAYLARGGDLAFGWVALVARALTALTALFVIIQSVRIWRKAQRRGQRPLI